MLLTVTFLDKMKELFLVFLGGGLGSTIRLILNKLVPSDSFPYSTLTVNLIGSFFFLIKEQNIILKERNQSFK